MTRSVRRLVGWLVGRSIGRSVGRFVCITISWKVGKFHFHAPIGALVIIIIIIIIIIIKTSITTLLAPVICNNYDGIFFVHARNVYCLMFTQRVVVGANQNFYHNQLRQKVVANIINQILPTEHWLVINNGKQTVPQANQRTDPGLMDNWNKIDHKSSIQKVLR